MLDHDNIRGGRAALTTLRRVLRAPGSGHSG
jgi:hypothetical protein